MTGPSTWALTARYVAALATVAALSLAGQVVVQTLLTTHEVDSRVINLAGRQRMLSQRIVKTGLVISTGSEARIHELRALATEWARVHHGLRHGDAALALSGHNSALVSAAFERIDASFQAMHGAALELLASPGQRDAVARLLAHEHDFLQGMEQIVLLYEQESRQRVRTLQRVELGLLSLVLLTLLMEGLFVFRPTVHRIRRALATLGRSEAEKAAILRAIPDLLLRVDASGAVQASYHASGRTGAQQPAPGALLDGLMDGRHAETLREHLHRATARGEDSRFEYQQQQDGATCHLEARVVPCGDDEALVIVRDLTERRQLEMEILNISEREQARIGQDLHDGLCQHLAGLAFMARSLANQAEQGREVARQDLRSLAELLQQGLVLARQMSRGLFPAVLVERGLGAALEELTAMMATLHKVRCTCDVDLEARDLDQGVAFQLYRIAQEALTNAIRHGQASTIHVSVSLTDDWLTLRIADNGVGMPPDGRPTTTGGMGLRSMAARARTIDAHLSLRSAEPSGTLIECQLPVSGSTPARSMYSREDGAHASIGPHLPRR